MSARPRREKSHREGSYVMRCREIGICALSVEMWEGHCGILGIPFRPGLWVDTSLGPGVLVRADPERGTVVVEILATGLQVSILADEIRLFQL